MYQKISEPIEVLAAFRKQGPEPMIFKRGNRHYQIKKVHLIHTERQGRDKIYIFSVSDETDAYRLAFSTESLTWSLEESAVL